MCNVNLKAEQGKVLAYCFILFFLTAFGSCKQQSEAELPAAESVSGARHPAPSPYLLTVDEVAQKLSSSTPPLLVEVSKGEKYAQGHLPGAINLWRPDYEDVDNFDYGGMKATRKKMAQLLAQLGVGEEELIIIYCTKGSADAARLLWILRGYGHENVAIMDGGKTGWQKAGYSLTQEVTPKRIPTDYHFLSPTIQGHSATLQEVLAAISDTNAIIIDTREDYEFFGVPYLNNQMVERFKKGAFAPGAIPGAIHLNWSEAVALHTDHTFIPLDSLKSNFLRKAITPDKRIIVYCQSGVRSAHTTFVLEELLKYPNVKNYDGSWIEWSFYHANNTSGKIQNHTGPEQTEKIYQDLVAGLNDPTGE